MINIYCSGGAYLNVVMEFGAMMHLLRDGIVNDDDFIDFTFNDGSKGSVRKSHINGICESLEEV